VGVVLLGLVVPLAVEALALVPAVARRVPPRAHRRLEVAIGLLVLAGGFVLRYVFVRGGQLSAFI
jgi:formate-dependent nitrite reductase membrane component NrfD